MSRSVALFLGLFLLLLSALTGSSRGQLQLGFYADTCPNAEAIVSSAVRQAVAADPTAAPALLRLHFHDCIVRVCSSATPIPTQLENECPDVVSCADIVALAARDSVALSNGPSYQVPTGRRDGIVSGISDAADMPDMKDSVDVLKSKFAAKGLSENDLVLLNGAHTIGTAACFFMGDRLYNFQSGGGPDPSINPQFLPELRSVCPHNGDVNARQPSVLKMAAISDLQHKLFPWSWAEPAATKTSEA